MSIKIQPQSEVIASHKFVRGQCPPYISDFCVNTSSAVEVDLSTRTIGITIYQVFQSHRNRHLVENFRM